MPPVKAIETKNRNPRKEVNTLKKSLIVVLGVVFVLSAMTTSFAAMGRGGSGTGTGTHMTGTMTPGSRTGTGMTGTMTPGSHTGMTGTGMTGTMTPGSHTGTGMMGTTTTH